MAPATERDGSVRTGSAPDRSGSGPRETERVETVGLRVGGSRSAADGTVPGRTEKTGRGMTGVPRSDTGRRSRRRCRRSKGP